MNIIEEKLLNIKKGWERKEKGGQRAGSKVTDGKNEF